MPVVFRQCVQVKADGTRCRGRALDGKEHCPFHDSSTQAAQAAGRRAGGRKRCQPAAVLPAGPDVPLGTIPDVVAFLGSLANKAAKGLLDPKTVNATTYVLSTLLRALEPGEIGRQVEELRAEVATLREARNGDGNTTTRGGSAPSGGGPTASDIGNVADPGSTAAGPGADHGDGDDAAGSVAGEAVEDDLFSAAPPLL